MWIEVMNVKIYKLEYLYLRKILKAFSLIWYMILTEYLNTNVMNQLLILKEVTLTSLNSKFTCKMGLMTKPSLYDYGEI